MDELAVMAQKAARERHRSWQRLKLEGLMLLNDVLSGIEAKLSQGKHLEEPQAVAQLLTLQEDLQQVHPEPALQDESGQLVLDACLFKCRGFIALKYEESARLRMGCNGVSVSLSLRPVRAEGRQRL
jgi:hypothetical protein